MDSQFLGSAVEMLILEVASEGPTYGYALAQTVGERSSGYFELKEGSLYPGAAPARAAEAVAVVWREADGRRRKYYELTQAGRAELAARKRSWHELRGRRQRRAGCRPAGLRWGLIPGGDYAAASPWPGPRLRSPADPSPGLRLPSPRRGEGKSDSAAFRR